MRTPERHCSAEASSEYQWPSGAAAWRWRTSGKKTGSPAGQTQGYHGTPDQVCGFLFFTVNRHSGPDNNIRGKLYTKVMADWNPQGCTKRIKGAR